MGVSSAILKSVPRGGVMHESDKNGFKGVSHFPSQVVGDWRVNLTRYSSEEGGFLLGTRRSIGQTGGKEEIIPVEELHPTVQHLPPDFPNKAELTELAIPRNDKEHRRLVRESGGPWVPEHRQMPLRLPPEGAWNGA